MLKQFTTHTVMALAEASLIALLVVGLIAGTAFAGRGGGGKPSGGGSAYSGSISARADSSSTTTATASPNRGDVVTFDISTSRPRSVRPARVLPGWHARPDGAEGLLRELARQQLELRFELRRLAGRTAADCTGSLVSYSKRGWSKYASTSFHVDA